MVRLHRFLVVASLLAAVIACDSGSETTPRTPNIVAQTLPNGVLGVSYSEAVQVYGGSGVLTFAITLGTLPTGLVLDTDTGEIYGTPTALGVYAFSITVTDSQGESDTESLSITITSVPAPTVLALEEEYGPPEAPVRIQGADFGASRGTSTVSIGGVSATEYVLWSDTSIIVLVPQGASSGLLVVTTAGGSDSASFEVTPATCYFVAPAPTGDDGNTGTRISPFATIQHGLNQATPGDWVVVRAGTYNERVDTSLAGGGTHATRIVIAGYPTETAVVDIADRCLNIAHSWYTVKDLEIDSNFSSNDSVRATNADNLILRRLTIYDAGATNGNGSGDAIDIEGGSNILVTQCEIYDCLAGSWTNQVDSHGVVAGQFTNLTISQCNIYRCSGDCVQADPDYDLWDNLVIEDCHLYTEEMPTAKASWAVNEIPGENAFDSKANPPSSAQSFLISNCVIHGFNSGYITNQAALNIKKSVNGTVERCIIYDSEIAFRMRGPAEPVTVVNCLVYNTTYGVRYEDGINDLSFLHCTFIDNVNHFYNGGGGGLGTGFVALNNLFEGAVPSECTDPSNMAVATTGFTTTFVNSSLRNYHLLPTAAAVDSGTVAAGIATDLDGNLRNVGPPDVGAYEYTP